MNLTNLRYFVTVAKLGSITRAAKATFVSESAVSKTIKQLEDELGVKLFDRQGRTIKLNQSGKIFFSYASDSLNLLDRGVSAVKSANNTETVPINVLFTVASPLIPTVAVKIKRTLPHVSLNIHQRTNFAKDFQQFDFIVSTKKIKDFTVIPLLTEELLVGSKAAINPVNDFVQAKELEKEDFIGESEDNELQQTIDHYLQKNELKFNFKYQSDEPATVRQLIMAGLGIGFIPQITWGKWVKSDQIRTARLLPHAPYRTIYLCSPHQELTPTQILFSNEIAAVFMQAKSTS